MISPVGQSPSHAQSRHHRNRRRHADRDRRRGAVGRGSGADVPRCGRSPDSTRRPSGPGSPREVDDFRATDSHRGAHGRDGSTASGSSASPPARLALEDAELDLGRERPGARRRHDGHRARRRRHTPRSSIRGYLAGRTARASTRRWRSRSSPARRAATSPSSSASPGPTPPTG